MRKITREYPWRLGVALLALSVFWLGATGLALAQSRADGEDPFSMEKVQGLTDPANGRASWSPANCGIRSCRRTRARSTAKRHNRSSGRSSAIGNFDRAWTTPTHMWPGGWTNGNFWSKWDADAGVQSGSNLQSGHDRRSRQPGARRRERAELCSRGIQVDAPSARAMSTATTPRKPTGWMRNGITRSTKRAGRHRLGVDVKMKIHQWTLN